MNRFEETLASGRPLLIDGGLATQLEAQGHDIGTALWSAELLVSQPEAIVEAHLAFLEAGAQCIASAGYQASRAGFRALGLSDDEADAMIMRAVELALEARRRFLAAHPDASFEPLVAASMGPYGAILHDGSEYTGEYPIDADGLERFHAQRLRLLDPAGADVLACETIPSATETAVLSRLLATTETPAWISFSCRDAAHLADGTPLAEVAATLADHPRVLALGVNCMSPRLIEPLIQCLRSAAPSKAILVYPNSGETYDAENNTWLGTVAPIDCGSAAREWIDAGAQGVGGCCRMGPAHIHAMHDELDNTE